MHLYNIKYIKLFIIFFFVYHFFLISLIIAETGENLIISSVNLEIINKSGNILKLKKKIYELISLKSGDYFSEKKLKETIQSLSQTNKFAQIYVDTKENDGKIAFIFKLTLHYVVKDIKISGQFPFFEREILNIMSIYPGDTFNEKKIDNQIELIRSFYSKEGFISSVVNIDKVRDSYDGYYTIYINIIKGDYFKLKQINLSGNNEYSDLFLKTKMKSFRLSLLPGSSGAFKDLTLKNDIYLLKKYYCSKGYLDADINYKVLKNPVSKNVVVDITISEGSLYKIFFVGNKQFSKRILFKNIDIFKSGNKDNMGIKRSIRQIKDLYKKKGYLETVVEVKDMIIIYKNNTFIQKIWFIIDEGPSTLIRYFSIKGNTQINTNKLKGQMLTKIPSFFNQGIYDPKILNEDISAIKLYYSRRGFLNMTLKKNISLSKDKSFVDIVLEIKEGRQTFISDISIEGDIDVLSLKKAFNSTILKKGDLFRQHLLEGDKNSLSHMIAEKGYPYVKVSEKCIFNDDKSEVTIVFTIDKGIFVCVNQIFFSGNFITKDSVIKNKIKMKKGDIFSLKKALNAQRNIRNMKIFNSVKFETTGLKERLEKVNFIVNLEEKKPYFLELGGGYESEKGGFANIKTGDNNLFGENKELWLAFDVSQTGNRAEMGIVDSDLFNWNISTAFAYYIERTAEFNKYFGTKISGWSLGFTNDLEKKFCFSLNFKYERRDQYLRKMPSDETEDLFEINEFKPRSVFVSTPSVSYDTRDSFIKPQKGIFTVLSADISKGIDNSLDNFIKYKFDLRSFYKLFNPLIIAQIIRINHIHSYGKKGKIPDDQLFFLGGTGDVRGFKENMLLYDKEENPLGGRSAFSGSIEARLDIGLNFELVLFYDIGIVKRPFIETVNTNFKSSIGGGFRYLTPIGPIGFLYGIKLDKQENEEDARLHFSLGYTY